MSQNDINDPRIDPRIRQFCSLFPVSPPHEFNDRQDLLNYYHEPERLKQLQQSFAMLEHLDNEELAPKAGLHIESFEIDSAPDENRIKLQLIRPDTEELLPCVYYIHGGGMMMMSCFDGPYQCWARLIAHQGCAVVLVDFRNSVLPSSAPQVAPFPAGLNDCVSGLRWVHAHAEKLKIDPERLVVAGESGGGNLSIASALKLKQEGDLGLISGIYPFCPYIAGQWPQEALPSSSENAGILIDTRGNGPRLSYGIEAFEAKNPLAWPLFASEDDVQGLPRTTIVVNEFDPLRDEGIAFYHLLLRAGVQARCQLSLGTVHASEIFVLPTPDISLDAAASLALFAKG